MFNCVKCGSVAHNYYNGVDICLECLFKGGLCSICGKPMVDEKPILNEKSDSILDYEKKYNIYDAVHLMKNHDVTMIDSYFKIEWKFKDGYKTLLGVRHNTPIDDFFNEDFGVFDLLDLTFTLVKPVEEVKEKWSEVRSRTYLMKLLLDGKTIRTLEYSNITDRVKPYIKVYTNTKINEEVYEVFGRFEDINYVVEYLEEN